MIWFQHKPATPRVRDGSCAEQPIRSLAKAVSWRVTGSIDTMLLSWWFTGDLAIAAAIGLTEVVTKMVLYYLHERAWNRIPLGRPGVGTRPPGLPPELPAARLERATEAV